jgi:CPA2 family monovalent cation:H+ antiporter-2
MHHGPLIGTIVVGLVLAFALGAIAQRLRLSPLVGYLLAGVAVGPFTPGFVADQALADELAEIGVILLMFGVGLHFSLRDLLAVRWIALPGAVGQIAVATLLGVALGTALGWTPAAGLVFGLALSVASTVVLLRALEERGLVDSERGRIAVGWLIVEDVAMVVVLVLLPAVAGLLAGEPPTATIRLIGGVDLGLWGVLALTLGKVVVFCALMMLVGGRVVPRLLQWVAQQGSRELFRLAVLAVALGIAYGAARLFDVSFALGAFFAGMILSESPLSQRAAEETLPLRDAFAVLFFVSVGMLFDPGILLRSPLEVAATVAIIVVGKSIAAYAIVRAFGQPPGTALTIAASLAQIGEFSFILAGLGTALALLPAEGRDLILAGALLSIAVNPLVFALATRGDGRRAEAARAAAAPAGGRELVPTTLTDHTVIVGYGRVGSLVAEGLKLAGEPFVVVEDRPGPRETARRDLVEVIAGNAVEPDVLAAAGVHHARRLLVAIPDVFEAGEVVANARAMSPELTILARAADEAERTHLDERGASAAISSEREMARAMLEVTPRPAPAAAGTAAPPVAAAPVTP